MGFYLGLVFFLLLFGIIISPNNNDISFIGNRKKAFSGKTVYCLASATIIICIIGLRSMSVGSDTEGYYVTFLHKHFTFSDFIIQYVDYLKSGVSNFFSSKNTSFYSLSYSLLKNIGFSFNGCLLIFAIIYVAPIFFLIRNESKNVWKSCFLYMVLSFSIGLSGVRISIAIGLTAISFILFRKEKKVTSIIVFIFAVMMHLSAIVFVFSFFIRRLNLTKKSLYYLIPIFVLMPLIGRFITPLILRYTYYENMDFQSLSWNLPIYLFFTVTTILLIWLSPDEYGDYHKMLILGTIICGLVNYGAFGNAHRYYSQYLCILLPGLTSKMNSTTKMVVELCYFIACGYLFLRTFSSSSTYVPYMFFWQN